MRSCRALAVHGIIIDWATTNARTNTRHCRFRALDAYGSTHRGARR